MQQGSALLAVLALLAAVTVEAVGGISYRSRRSDNWALGVSLHTKQRTFTRRVVQFVC